MKSKKPIVKSFEQTSDGLVADIAGGLDFIVGIRTAVAELNRNEFFTAEELLKCIPEWARGGK